MSQSRDRTLTRSHTSMLFGRKNFQWAGIGCLLVFVGFLIMYLENEVYGWISLNVSPWMILAGYGVVLYAIVQRFGNRKQPENSSDSAARKRAGSNA